MLGALETYLLQLDLLDNIADEDELRHLPFVVLKNAPTSCSRNLLFCSKDWKTVEVMREVLKEGTREPVVAEA